MTFSHINVIIFCTFFLRQDLLHSLGCPGTDCVSDWPWAYKDPPASAPWVFRQRQALPCCYLFLVLFVPVVPVSFFLISFLLSLQIVLPGLSCQVYYINLSFLPLLSCPPPPSLTPLWNIKTGHLYPMIRNSRSQGWRDGVVVTSSCWSCRWCWCCFSTHWQLIAIFL